MKNKILAYMVLLVLVISVASVVTRAEDFTAAKQLVDSNVSCSDLTQDQLESIGDYYMELMHPGSAHEAMDQMMGGEGSETLKNMHISMAERFYCDNSDYSGYGMMGSQYSGGMMGGYGGMMNPGYYGSNMMYYNQPFYTRYFNFWPWVLLIAAGGIVLYLLLKKDSPEKVLKMRLAKGDITKTEFEKLKKELK